MSRIILIQISLAKRLDFYYNLAREVLKDKAAHLDDEDTKLAQRQAIAPTNQEEYIHPSDSKKRFTQVSLLVVQHLQLQDC